MAPYYPYQKSSFLLNPSCDLKKLRDSKLGWCSSQTVDARSQDKQNDLQLKAFGGDGMNRFGQEALNQTASGLNLVAVMVEQTPSPRRQRAV